MRCSGTGVARGANIDRRSGPWAMKLRLDGKTGRANGRPRGRGLGTDLRPERSLVGDGEGGAGEEDVQELPVGVTRRRTRPVIAVPAFPVPPFCGVEQGVLRPRDPDGSPPRSRSRGGRSQGGRSILRTAPEFSARSGPPTRPGSLPGTSRRTPGRLARSTGPGQSVGASGSMRYSPSSAAIRSTPARIVSEVDVVRADRGPQEPRRDRAPHVPLDSLRLERRGDAGDDLPKTGFEGGGHPPVRLAHHRLEDEPVPVVRLSHPRRLSGRKQDAGASTATPRTCTAREGGRTRTGRGGPSAARSRRSPRPGRGT